MANDIAVVFRLNAMGDILLTIPTLRALEKQGYEVHLVINSKWKALAEFLPAKIHLFYGASDILRLSAELRKLKPQVVYDLQGKLSTVLMRNLLGTAVSGVYKKRELSEQIQVFRNQIPFRFQNQKQVWLKYAETCGVKALAEDAELNLSDEYIKECEEIAEKEGLKPYDFVLIHPEASKAGKEIPNKLLEEIINKINLPVAVTGGSKKPLDINSNFIDIRGKYDLKYLPGIVKCAKSVISSDSGPMHMARAVNVPLVGCFFQTDPCLGFAPIPSDKTAIVTKDLPCKPCSLHGQNETCPVKSWECRNIEADEVLNKLKSVLK